MARRFCEGQMCLGYVACVCWLVLGWFLAVLGGSWQSANSDAKFTPEFIKNHPKFNQKSAKMIPKSIQHLPKWYPGAPREAFRERLGRPTCNVQRARRYLELHRSFWRAFWHHLTDFWSHFGPSWGSEGSPINNFGIKSRKNRKNEVQERVLEKA